MALGKCKAKPASGGRVIETVVVVAAEAEAQAEAAAAAHFKCKCVCGVNAVLQNILYSRADTDRQTGRRRRERERERRLCIKFAGYTF